MKANWNIKKKKKMLLFIVISFVLCTPSTDFFHSMESVQEIRKKPYVKK